MTNERSSLLFGWFVFRPKWLQFLNTPRWFLFFLCQYFFTQSIVVNGVYPGSVSTIERRFGFTSLMMGWLTSSFDIFALLLTPLVSYVGGSRKKPVFCGVGLFTMGIGFFVFILPHVISDSYQAGQVLANVSSVSLCTTNHTVSTAEVCDEKSVAGNLWYYSLFVLGMVLAGAGATPMYSLGIPYMDENVKAKVAPLYVGTFTAGGILGAVVGFVAIFFFLSIFVDLGVPTSITPRDQRWVGAWWLGFAIFGTLCVLWSLWLLGFPKEFPATKERREFEMKDIVETEPDEEEDYTKLADILKATKLVFSCLPFVTVTLAGCMDNLVITASVAFMPKIIQSKFRLLPGSAAILYGCTSIPAAFVGNIVGSYINKKLKLGLRGAAKMCSIVAVFGFVLTLPLLINCDQVTIAGVNTPYTDSSSAGGLWSPCNSACNCSGVTYSPVCADGSTYFSGCHAGCAHASPSRAYSNCSCAITNLGALVEANPGACDVNCGVKLVLFLAVCFMMSFVLFLKATPAVVVTLRSVPLSQRSYAVGLQMIMARLLGSIPGPVVMGSLIDYACILWNKRCSEKSNCLEYNTTQLTWLMVGLFASSKFVAMVLFFTTWLLCRRSHETHSGVQLRE